MLECHDESGKKRPNPFADATVDISEAPLKHEIAFAAHLLHGPEVIRTGDIARLANR